MSGRAAAPAPAWRLLLSEPLDGATNMAVDEALWRGRLSGEGLPTVRFFGWAPPAIPLGYGQRRGAPPRPPGPPRAGARAPAPRPPAAAGPPPPGPPPAPPPPPPRP